MEKNTKVCIVETNPHRQTSCVWTGTPTVGEVIDIVNEETASSTVQPVQFLHSNNKFNPADFLDEDGAVDYDKVTEWEYSLPIEAHFQAAIDCAADDGHIISVYWTREEAEEAGAPRYMTDEAYKKKLDSIFR